MTDHISKWMLSNDNMTTWARTKNGIIMDAAPDVQSFIGQPLDNLANWLGKSGPLDIVPLETHRC
jgi:hypothetical protein